MFLEWGRPCWSTVTWWVAHLREYATGFSEATFWPLSDHFFEHFQNFFLTTFGSLFWTLSDFFLDHFRVTFLWWFCIFWKYIYKDFYYFSSHLCETFLAVAKCQNNFMFVENQEILYLKIFSENIFILEINILKIYIFCVFDGPISTSFAPLEIAEMSQQISKNQLKWSQRTPSHTLLRCAAHHVMGIPLTCAKP